MKNLLLALLFSSLCVYAQETERHNNQGPQVPNRTNFTKVDINTALNAPRWTDCVNWTDPRGGDICFDVTDSAFEFYNGSSWVALGTSSFDPNSISVDLTPSPTLTYDLGSDLNEWALAYIENLQNVQVLDIEDGGGAFFNYDGLPAFNLDGSSYKLENLTNLLQWSMTVVENGGTDPAPQIYFKNFERLIVADTEIRFTGNTVGDNVFTDLQATNPTKNNTVLLPDDSGTLMLTSAYDTDLDEVPDAAEALDLDADYTDDVYLTGDRVYFLFDGADTSNGWYMDDSDDVLKLNKVDLDINARDIKSTAGNVDVVLDDNAGVRSFVIKDNLGVSQFAVDSNGNITGIADADVPNDITIDWATSAGEIDVDNDGTPDITYSGTGATRTFDFDSDDDGSHDWELRKDRLANVTGTAIFLAGDTLGTDSIEFQSDGPVVMRAGRGTGGFSDTYLSVPSGSSTGDARFWIRENMATSGDGGHTDIFISGGKRLSLTTDNLGYYASGYTGYGTRVSLGGYGYGSFTSYFYPPSENNDVALGALTDQEGDSNPDPFLYAYLEELILKPTDSPPTCNAARKGAIYYDASLSEACDCNGTSWAQIDGGGGC